MPNLGWAMVVIYFEISPGLLTVRGAEHSIIELITSTSELRR